MDRLELIDAIRKYALGLMSKDPNLDYAEATKQAKIAIVGHEIRITDYNDEKNKVESAALEELSYKSLVTKELEGKIKVELYSEEQLKEIVIANRMGIDVTSFINIFYTPDQIRFITLMASANLDITPYMTNLTFDPDEEMRKLDGSTGDSEPIEESKEYVLTNAA
jgi:hypothetical protein